ncbi:MAG: hypothetical protein R3E68_13510 [Burkholderiaceae bacterium]
MARAICSRLSGERLPATAQHGAMQMAIDGTDVRALGIAQRRSHGLAFIPEERLGRATVPGMALDWNLLLSRREPDWFSWGFLRRRRLAALARRLIERHQVRAAGPAALAVSLTGGNLQKYVVARELEPGPTVLLVSQPTWGVDVGAAARIHQALLDLRAAGAGILLVSEDLDELFALCDAFHVMSAGRLSARLAAEQAGIEQIGRLMGTIDDAVAA